MQNVSVCQRGGEYQLAGNKPGVCPLTGASNSFQRFSEGIRGGGGTKSAASRRHCGVPPRRENDGTASCV